MLLPQSASGTQLRFWRVVTHAGGIRVGVFLSLGIIAVALTGAGALRD
jgi:hypothetical protein